MDESFFSRVYRIVERIPCGKVVSYGQIARALGYPQAARQVGWAMHRSPDSLPWQRVLRADGTVAGGGHAEIRRALLEAEGVPFLPDGRVDMAACQWDMEKEKPRCRWCLGSAAMRRYHDEEWGVPLRDDRRQFEFLMLEAMQCGLNWAMMIQKREIFRACFDGFDFDAVASYGEEDVRRVLETPGMIRSRRKIEAVVHNARCFVRIREEFGSFSAYLWRFTGNRALLYAGHRSGDAPARNALSDRVAEDLRRRGFKYLGSVTLYAHLQACGIVNDHAASCFRFQEILELYPGLSMEAEEEHG